MSEDSEFEGWRAVIHDERIRIVEVDLDDDGQVERIIMVAGYGLCGSIGCQSLILHKRNGKWQIVAKASLSGGFLLLDEKKFGWHRIFTGEEIYTFRLGTFFESVEIDSGEIFR